MERARLLLLQPLSHRFRPNERPKEILSRQLFQVVVRPTPPRQLGEQRGIRRYVFQPLHYLAYPIEIGTNSDVIDASDLAHVFDLVGDL